MPISICTRCLSRLHLGSARTPIPVTTSLIQSSNLHTTSILQAPNTQNAAKHKIIYRNVKAASYRNKRRDTKKLPSVGERRQQRTRIVLSNANALEVNGLEDLSLRNFSDEKNVGRVLAFDGQVIDQLREVRGFKKSQSWGLFRRPATLVRKETVQIAKWMVAEDQEGKRVVVSGEKSGGKSVLLAQAMAMAFMKGWVVMTIPEAQEYTMNHFAYAPVPKTKDTDVQMYTQPTLAASLLSRTANANAAVLSKLKPNTPPPESARVPSASANNLHTIAKYGADHPSAAHDIFTYLLKELTTAGKEHRPPVLFTVDNLNHWMGPSKYKSAEFETVHSHQLTMIHTYLDLLFSAKKPLANGGLILAATSGSNVPTNPSFDLLLKQVKAAQQGKQPTDKNFPLPNPYQKVDSRPLNLLDPAAGTQLMPLQGVSKAEAAQLMQYYVLSGVLKESVTPESISEKWTLSGGGNVGEICRWGEKARLDPEKLVTKFGTNEGIKIGQGEHRPRG